MCVSGKLYWGRKLNFPIIIFIYVRAIVVTFIITIILISPLNLHLLTHSDLLVLCRCPHHVSAFSGAGESVALFQIVSLSSCFFPPLTVIPRLVPVADTARLTWVSQGCPSDSGRFRDWAQFRARDTGPGRVPVMLSSEASCSYRSLLRKSSRSTDLKTSRRPVRHIQAKVCAAPCRDAAVMDKVFVESAPIRSGSCVVRVACVRENPLLDVRQSGPEPSLWDAPAHPRFSRPSTLSLLSVSALLSGLTHPY